LLRLDNSLRLSGQQAVPVDDGGRQVE
jgi:hypothetical protein